jgi:hypothetical protein
VGRLIQALLVLVCGVVIVRLGSHVWRGDGLAAAFPFAFGSSAEPSQAMDFLPMHVKGLVQKAYGLRLNPQETGLIALSLVVYATIVGTIFRLMIGEAGFGVVLNSLTALGGVWLCLLVYNFRTEIERPEDLRTLLDQAIVASVALPVVTIMIKAFLKTEMDTLMAGGGSRAGDAVKSLVAKGEDVANAIAGRQRSGPSAKRIRSALGQRKRQG